MDKEGSYKVTVVTRKKKSGYHIIAQSLYFYLIKFTFAALVIEKKI